MNTHIYCTIIISSCKPHTQQVAAEKRLHGLEYIVTLLGWDVGILGWYYGTSDISMSCIVILDYYTTAIINTVIELNRLYGQ